MHAETSGPIRELIPVDRALVHSTVRIAGSDWALLRGHLLSTEHEQAAILMCGLSHTIERTTFLVREVITLDDADYLHRGSLHLSIAPSTLARYMKRARLEALTVILCHSHPFAGQVAASPIDLSTETELCGRALPNRLKAPTAALVFGPDSIDGRAWTAAGAAALNAVHVIGDTIETHRVSSHGITNRSPNDRTNGRAAKVGIDNATTATPVRTTARTTARTSASPSATRSGNSAVRGVADEEATARQALLWGAAGQDILRNAAVAVIGCGGTGSHIVTQLAHLGLGTLTLIDPDRVEASNLSRLVGSTAADIGEAKVDVLAAVVERINPLAHVETAQQSVLDIDPSRYIGADVLVCATDGHGSRALLIEAARQYLTPLVDLGVEVDPTLGSFRAGGGVRIIGPDTGCLLCADTLSPELIREEYLDAEQRAREAGLGYIRAANIAAPSVVALNGVVASLAVLEVCQLLVGMLGSGRNRLLYRAEGRGLTTAALPARPDCHVCGTPGIRALGDSRQLPTRWRPTVTSAEQALP